MDEDGTFLLVAISAWFVPIFWHAFCCEYLPIVKRRIKTCRELINQFIAVEKLERSEPAQRMLEETYKDLGKHLTTTRRATTVSIQKVSKLEVQIDARRESLKEFNYENLLISADPQLKKLEHMLELEKRNTDMLRLRSTDLEVLVSKVYTQKQVYAARSAAARSLRRANYHLSTSDTKPIAALLEEKELQTKQAEMRAVKDFTKIVQNLSRLDSRSTNLDELNRLLLSSSTSVEQLNKALLEFQNTSWLSQQIRAEGQADTWKTRSAMASQQKNLVLTKQALERSISYRKSAEQFAEMHSICCEAKLQLEGHVQSHIALQEEINRKIKEQKEIG